MAAALPVLESTPETGAEPLKRVVYPGEEQAEIAVPMDCLLRGNNLDIYPDVLSKNFFRLHLKKGRIAFQAAGFLGFIPLNDRIAIEVRSRVPIANLERLLLMAPAYAPEILKLRQREFGMIGNATPSLIDLLAFRLLDTVDLARSEGLHYEYERRTNRGLMPHGRILPFESVAWQAKTGNQLAVTYSAFERSYDTAANRCLRSALRNLRDTYRGMTNRRGARAIAARLGRAEEFFEHATLDRRLRFLLHPSIVDPSKLPSTKAAYVPAIIVAKSILKNHGIDIRNYGNDATFPCILINMEDVFESYIRTILQPYLRDRGFRVLNGNINEPTGAARALFDSSEPGVKENRSKPDIVIYGGATQSNVEVVIDAKYKPPGVQPDREDINQVLVYSVVYNCKRVALAYPRRKSTEPNVQRIGSIGGIEVFKFLIDLGAEDLIQEEKKLTTEVNVLLSQRSTRP